VASFLQYNYGHERFLLPDEHLFINKAQSAWFLLEMATFSSLSFPAKRVLETVGSFLHTFHTF